MDLSPVTNDSIVITIVYTVLLFWGAWVDVRQVYQGFRRRTLSSAIGRPLFVRPL